jgi:hypothetical protein
MAKRDNNLRGICGGEALSKAGRNRGELMVEHLSWHHEEQPGLSDRIRERRQQVGTWLCFVTPQNVSRIAKRRTTNVDDSVRVAKSPNKLPSAWMMRPSVRKQIHSKRWT